MNKNLIKILSTLGLIVAIALILKGVFGVGNVGFKKVTESFNKSKKTKLPTLECTIRIEGETNKQIFNLQKLVDNEPKDIPIDSMDRRKYFAKDPLFLQLVTEHEQNNQYIINTINNKNGKANGMIFSINRSTGDLELVYFGESPIGLSAIEIVELAGKAKRFYGSCFKM